MRYLKDKSFPPYAFIPGLFPHPEKAGGYMHGHELVVSPLSQTAYAQNEAYLFGLDLFNHQYYWEAHVYWEALWHEAGRKGDIADFLKGLIKISAGGVKYKMDQPDLAVGHLKRAMELISGIDQKSCFLGVDIKQLLVGLESTSEKLSKFEELRIYLEDIT